MRRVALILALPFALSACVSSVPDDREPLEELPEQVLAIAAPGQDLASVTILEDGCYWYRYEGPVESTFLPLETREGRMICTRPQS